MISRFILTATALVLVSACGPLIELEDENIALRSRVDSLEIALAECGSGTDLAHERLAVIERQNLQLDDNNRQLQARLTELQFQPAAAEAPQQHQSVAGQQQPGSERLAATQQVSPPVPAAAQPSSAPDYRMGTSPDLAFLRDYQAALSAYNAKQYQRAAQLFSGLTMTSAPNDMIDNCVYWLGEARLQLGETEEALARFTTVLGFEGSDKIAATLLSRGRVLMNAGRRDEAKKDFQRLINEHPKSEQARTARQLLRKLH
jgi:TolA-binding protein